MPRDRMQSLWIGARLSAMEALSIASFLHHGHEYDLFVYDDVANVPRGVTLRDAREILPRDRVFQYRQFASVSGFSNMFRYKLLVERGGWWVDTDVVCLRPFEFGSDHVFASEIADGNVSVSSCVLRAPKGSDAMHYALDVCEAKDPQQLEWGETGPRLMAEVVDLFGLRDAVQPPQTFCPLRYDEWARVLDDVALPDDAFAVHLWNEMWRRNACDKDATYCATSLYERLKREKRSAEETALP